MIRAQEEIAPVEIAVEDRRAPRRRGHLELETRRRLAREVPPLARLEARRVLERASRRASLVAAKRIGGDPRTRCQRNIEPVERPQELGEWRRERGARRVIERRLPAVLPGRKACP